jgi:broad specificity phosphatase PhoE
MVSGEVDARPWRDLADRGALAVLLIRHGRTSFNAEQRFCGGRSDPPLDAHGREQAAALERFVGEVERVFCSPQQRARETAAVLGPPVVVEALRELDQGELEGNPFAPALIEHAEFFRAWKRDPTHVCIPGGGESMGALADRVALGMTEILAQLEGEPVRSSGRVIAVVGHQVAQAAFVCRAIGRPLREWPQFQLRNATANLLSWDRGAWSLVERNL